MQNQTLPGLKPYGRARSLVQLKNNEDAIRAALKSSSSLSASEIEEIIKDAFSVYETQQKQQNQADIDNIPFAFIIIYDRFLYCLERPV